MSDQRAADVGSAWPGSLAWVSRLAAPLLEERDRWPLWLPVAIGLGVVAYFQWPREPAWMSGPAIIVAGALIARLMAPPGHASSQASPHGAPYGDAGAVVRGVVRGAGLLILLAGLGFSAAQYRAETVATPMLFEETRPVDVSGRIIAREVSGARVRLTLDQVTIEDMAPEQTPLTVRLSAPMAPPAIGDRVDGLGVLLPPSGPVLPGGYDFRRAAYFDSLGGIGYFLGAPSVVPGPGAGGAALWLEARRAAMGDAIRAGLGDRRATGIAVALLTGERQGISDATAETLRRSGLAHLLAISGLHVGLVAGLVFFAVRAILAAWEAVALTQPIKKWAALAALAAALGYTLMVGATVPTQRAFVMTALVLVAICLDRTALSLRLVAWAAAAVLILVPESALGPSFQMSFAAVLALVATYEAMAPAWSRWRQGGGAIRRFGLYIAGVAVTSLIAGTATAPFALYHFQHVAAYGLAANMLAVPLMAFWIMPWGLAAFALAPFGLAALALAPMAWGIDGMVAIAETVAGWPGSWWRVAMMPGLSLALIVAGGLWLCLWRSPWRRWGMVPIALGALVAILTPRPDLLISRDGDAVAVRAGDTLFILGDRPGGFVLDQWQRGLAASVVAPRPVGQVIGDDLAIGCDIQACVIDRLGQRIAVVDDPAIWQEACAEADLIIARDGLPRSCPVPVVSRWSMDGDPARSLRFVDGGLIHRSVAEEQGERPWRATPLADPQ